MPKSKSILQDNKECYLSHKSNCHLHIHHIFGAANRDISDREGFWVYLIPELHNMSDDGVHFNHELDLKLKRACQAKYESMGHARADFIQLIGRSYL